MKILPIVTSLMILSMASSAQAVPFRFQNYQATYTLRYDGIPFGKSTTTLNVDKKNLYSLCIDNKTTLPFLHGNVVECSKGVILKNTIKPLTYDYHYHHNSQRTDVHIDFDWKKNIASMTTKNTTWHIPIPHNTQDKISYQLLLRRGLAEGQTLFDFPIADGGKLKAYRFDVIHQNHQTITLKRSPMINKENVTLWFRKDLDYLVSEVKQTKHIADVGTAELTAYHLSDSHV